MFFHYCTCFWPPWIQEFNTKGIKVVSLPPNIMFPIQPVNQGPLRLITHGTLWKRSSVQWKKASNREHHESLEKSHHWGYHFVIENVMKATQPKTINSCWKKCVELLCMTSQGFITEPNKGIMKKRLWIWGKKMRWKVSRYGSWS